MKLLVLIFIIVFLLFFCFKVNIGSSFHEDIDEKNFLIDNLYNGDTLNGYRLADVIFYPDYLTAKHQYTTVEHLYKYQDTIGSKYIKQRYPFLQKINTPEDLIVYKDEYSNFENYLNENIKNTQIDIELLNEIIKQTQEHTFNFDTNTLLLHVRVGDVLCKYNSSSHAFEYSKKENKKWWDEVLNYIQSNKIETVIIIAGTHFKECLDESANYLQDVKKLLTDTGVKVFYRVGHSPDEDLIFSKNAHHFITTGGGYGYFLGKIVELNNGNFVLNKKDTIRKEIKLF